MAESSRSSTAANDPEQTLEPVVAFAVIRERVGCNLSIPSQRSKVAPALVFDGAGVRLVRVDETSSEPWMSSYDSRGWTISERVGDARSKATPALAPYAGSIQLVHLDTASNEIWHRHLE